MNKLAIILRAFGSTEPEHRRVREAVLTAYQGAFPGAELRFVLSSRQVRVAEGLPDFETTVEELAKLSCDLVVVQHLLLVPGQMYAEAMELPHGLACRVGAPLLRHIDDAQWLAAELVRRLDPATPTIFAVHGNTRNPQYNRMHVDLWERFQALLPDDATVALASLEGEPGIGPMLDLKVPAAEIGKAHLVPLFLFPGGHVLDDLLGGQDDSWRNQLAVPTTSSPTLMELDWIVERFIANTKAALN